MKYEKYKLRKSIPPQSLKIDIVEKDNRMKTAVVKHTNITDLLKNRKNLFSYITRTYKNEYTTGTYVRKNM